MRGKGKRKKTTKEVLTGKEIRPSSVEGLYRRDFLGGLNRLTYEEKEALA